MNISNIRNTLLTWGLTESNHAINYLLVHTREVDKNKKYKREEFLFKRSALVTVTLFQIDGTEVWAKQDEAQKLIEVINNTKDNYLTAWHIVGSTTPLIEDISTFRQSGIDGYQLHVIYNTK